MKTKYLGFINDVSKYLRYPAVARESGIEGLCVVNYKITKEGKVENFDAIQDPGGGIENATIEIIKLATEGISFSPAILNGNPVSVKKELKLMYKL